MKGPFEAHPPEVLYHYTSWDGAEGILSTQRFWFTAHDCTNDPAELESADQLVTDTAKALMPEADEVGRALLNTFAANYRRFKLPAMVGPVYLACFSVARSSRSQWDCYADRGRGLCLGVEILKDEEAAGDLPVVVSLHPVEYSERVAQRRVETTLRAVCQALSLAISGGSARSRRPVELALSAMYRMAAFTALSTKKAQWRREREWRQVAFPRPGQKVKPLVRNSSGREIRYLALPVRQPGRPIALYEVIIGPNQNEAEARKRLGCLLARTGYPCTHAGLPRITVAHRVPCLTSGLTGRTGHGLSCGS